MEDDDYRARPDDHLVEPFFAGLGKEAEEAEKKPDRRSGWGCLALLLALSIAFWGLVTAYS